MPVTTDIRASYVRPGAVVRDHLARGVSEPRALAFVMGGCLLLFLSRLPGLSRQAALNDTDLTQLMSGELVWWVFFAPLLLYLLALLVNGVMKLIGRPISYFASRLALFWALLAASPLYLLGGLTHGFVGEGLELDLVRAIGWAVFLTFWIVGLVSARRVEAGA